MKPLKTLTVVALAASLLLPSSIAVNAAPVETASNVTVALPSAYQIIGGINTAWIASGGAQGVMGLPTSNEVGGLKNGGAYQFFKGGAIIWSPATGGKLSTYGAIRSAWAQTKYENGVLGYPTTNIVKGLKNGGMYQNYQGGAIIWSPQTGARLSTNGEIRTAWSKSGFENGVLGYPTSNMVGGLKNGGMYQNYQGGTIIWSPATGAAISRGAIRTAWGATGFENGRLGYPTTNEFAISGGVQQSFQGGIIAHTGAGTKVTYIDHSPAGAKAFAKTLLAQKGLSSSQNTCLVTLWERESNWNVFADNPWSDAYGIPQSLPGNKMASVAPDWASNSQTQIKWGINYIMDRYGTPCDALKHSNINNWY